MNNNNLIPLLPDMAVFVTVAEEESFSEAGRKLGMATSSVSRSVNRLEKSLQTKLLERTTRKVRLSTAGTDVYLQSKQMLQSAQSAVRAAQSLLEDAVGDIRIAAPKAFANQVLSPMVLDFLETYPGINMTFRVADHFIDPVGDEVDVIFRLTDQPSEGLVSKTLTKTRLVLCASPAYLATHGVPSDPDELAAHLCISLGEKIGDEVWQFTKEQQSKTVKTQGRISVNHTEMRKKAALRHLGIGMFPEFTVTSEIDTGALVAVLPDWCVTGNYQGEVIIQFAQSKFMPVPIRKFIDFIVEAFRETETKIPD